MAINVSEVCNCVWGFIMLNITLSKQSIVKFAIERVR